VESYGTIESKVFQLMLFIFEVVDLLEPFVGFLSRISTRYVVGPFEDPLLSHETLIGGLRFLTSFLRLSVILLVSKPIS